MDKKILTVQDISCVGQCSLTVALPIISACGIETCILPSAVLSTHTGGFSGYTFRDLTDDMPLIASSFIAPIVKLKRETFRSATSHLNSHEMLIALSSSAAVNPQADKALGQISRLRGCELHSSVMLCDNDERVLKKLGVNFTCEPVRRSKGLF